MVNNKYFIIESDYAFYKHSEKNKRANSFPYL